jgi:hypothetical protein
MRALNYYKGLVRDAVHEATKGKRTEAIQDVIWMLQDVIDDYQAILDRRATTPKVFLWPVTPVSELIS